jgi:hypothetical protein
MPQRELEAVIGRAIVDQEFHMQLFAYPTAALAGYELTEAEVVALRLVDAESMYVCAFCMVQRLAQGLVNTEPTSIE